MQRLTENLFDSMIKVTIFLSDYSKIRRSTMKKFDIVICGAGPAGAAFAMTAPKDMKILLLDGTVNPKPCGGLLAPDAQKALASFELTLPKEILVDPQIFSVRTIDMKTGLVRRYQRMYINVDRDKFDKWMVSQSGGNVEIAKARLTSCSKSGDGFVSVCKSENGDEFTVTSKYIVGSDGANSIVRRTFFPKLKTRQYVAIQQWFDIDENTPDPFYSCIFDPETSACCSWSIYKDNYVIFGGAYEPEHCRERFEKQKEKMKDFGLELKKPVKTEGCLVLRPSSPASFCTGKDGIFLIGEAAGFISPSSLEGISSAINSAVALSDSFKEGGNIHGRYSKKVIALRMKLLAKNLKCPFMYNPTLRKLVMKSGITALKLK